jgi:hypothetical protein
MVLGFPAYAEGHKAFDCPPDWLFRAARVVTKLFGWRTDKSYQGFAVRVPWSFWSWGERFLIHVSARSTIEVRSECLLPTQCIDWGKNRANVERFLGAVRRVVDELAPDDSTNTSAAQNSHDNSQFSERPPTPPTPQPARAGDDS